MPPKSAFAAAALCVAVFVGATVAMKAARPQPEPATAEVAPPPAEPAAAARPEPHQPAPPPPAKAASEPPRPPAPQPPNPVLARWGVPAVRVDGREDSFATDPQTVAVNNAGTRVMVATSRLVDVWEKGRAAAVRLQPKRISGAFVSPDASRAYIVNDELEALETFDAAGKRVGSWAPPPVKPGWHLRFDYTGFHPTTGKLTIGVHYAAPDGFYTVSPETGQGTLALRFAEGGDVFSCRRIFPLTDGRYVAHYEPEAGVRVPPGVYELGTDGKPRTSPRIPAEVGKNERIRTAAVSADGRLVAAVVGRELTLWDAHGGTRLFTWAKEYYYPYACAFTRDRLLIAAASDYEEWHTKMGSVVGVNRVPGLLQLYDLGTRKPVGEFRPSDHRLPARVVALSPDGSKLALAGGKEVAVIDAEVAFGPPR